VWHAPVRRARPSGDVDPNDVRMSIDESNGADVFEKRTGSGTARLLAYQALQEALDRRDNGGRTTAYEPAGADRSAEGFADRDRHDG